VIAATDGHMLAEDTMGILECDNEGDFAFTISADDIKNLIQLLCNKKAGYVNLTYEGEKITVDCPKFTYRFESVSSRFPDYRKFIPEGKKRLTLPAANSAYLLKALTAIGVGECIDIGYSDAESPFILTTRPDDPFRVVVMPMYIGLQIAESGGINA